jgi:predicted metal-dependent hydrolase
MFNEQRYWECHETLEQIWRREPKGEEKDVQQGIILAASAFVHHQKNEDNVCIGMMPKALSKLEMWHEKMYYMVDIENLKERLKEIQSTHVIRLFKI